MIEFGKTLRLAREAKGYTPAQVADITRMSPGTVTELEDEDFSHIAALIYGRGFVKLYCEAVGLDPKPMVEEFTAIYNGSRDVPIRERRQPEQAQEPNPLPPAPTAPEPPPAAPELPTTTPEPQPELPAFRQANLDAEPSSAPMPAPEPAPAPVATVPPPAEDFAAATPDPRPFSRYAAPVRQMHAPSISPTIWRVGVLGLIALLALWGIALGIRALYRATSGQAAPETPPATLLPAAPEPATTTSPAPPPPTAKAPAQKAPATKAPATKPPTTKAPAAKAPAEKAPSAKPPATKAPAAKKPAAKTARKPQKIPSLYVD